MRSTGLSNNSFSAIPTYQRLGWENIEYRLAPVLGSLASAVTALLGFAIRSERPSLPQWIGISIITFGVIALKLTSEIVSG